MGRAYNHLGGATESLYTELLDLSLSSWSPPSVPRATVVSKTVRTHRYLYLQRNLGGHRQQLFLGPDDEKTRGRVKHLRDEWEATSSDAQPKERLVAMLRAAGAQGPDSQTARVLQALSRHGVFRSGAVLIGTQALVTMGSALGVSWARPWKTDDIDVASERLRIVFGGSCSVPDALSDTGMAFHPIPGLDPRKASTSYKLRGRSLRLDLLTPLQGPESCEPVHLPNLNVSATPLRHLDYLIEDPMPVAQVARAGDLIIVPQPSRFALHKLLVASRRPPAWANRASKDRRQAEALLALLADERPEDLRGAWHALGEHHSKAQERVMMEIQEIDSSVREVVLKVLGC